MSQAPPSDPFVRVYDKTVPDELCERIIETFERDTAGHTIGKTASGYDPEVNRTTVLMIGARMEDQEGRKLWSEIDAEIFGHLQVSLTRYFNDVPTGHYLAGQAKVEDSGYFIQKYDKGEGFFASHIDSSEWRLAFRLAAAILYLNTVEEGGRTFFPQHNLGVKPVRGRVLWFPATWTYEHEAMVPISDDRWSISTFLCHRGHKLLGCGGPAHKIISEAINAGR